MSIDLFRPYVAPEAATNLAALFAPDAEGRVFIGEGPRVAQFERAFGALVGSDVLPVATNSCTSALDLAYELCGIGPGDAVITTPITCTATNLPLLRRGARIIWADVDPLTGNIDPLDVAQKMTRAVKAIVAVDWAGRPCDYANLRRFDVPVVEDAAHSLLATVDAEGAESQPVARVGGDYVCWSLGPIKHLTAGDGGMLVTHRGDAARARLLRWYGLDRTSTADFRCGQDITEAGWKAHMTDLNATIGLANLPGTAERVAAHRRNAWALHLELRGLEGITLLPFAAGSAHWVFTLLADERDGFMAHMTARGVQTSRVHARNDRHTAFRQACGSPLLPNVDFFDAHQVSLPCGWWLTDNDLARVVDAVRAWCRRPVGAGAARGRE